MTTNTDQDMGRVCQAMLDDKQEIKALQARVAVAEAMLREYAALEDGERDVPGQSGDVYELRTRLTSRRSLDLGAGLALVEDMRHADMLVAASSVSVAAAEKAFRPEPEAWRNILAAVETSTTSSLTVKLKGDGTE